MRISAATLTLTVAVLNMSCSGNNLEDLPFRNSRLGVEKRVDDLLGRMTLDEKLDMLSGANWMDTVAIPRLGIPSIHMSDGPMGIRTWAGPDDPDSADTPKTVHATAFPAGIAIAATWNPDIAALEGRTIAQEALALGRDQMLGPTVNVSRTPLWGRNFEGYGEDPWLASRMAVAYISAMQGEGVIATVKHYAANNQEFRRNTVNVKVDERTLNEIYFPAFRAAVEEAGVWSVMSAYNKVNGMWCSENPYLLTDVLKKSWGFKGFVVSDWASTHDTAGPANAGLDVEMPGATAIPGLLKYFRNEPGGNPGFDGGYLTREKVKPLVTSGQIPQAKIDDKVRRILRAMFGTGLFDRKRQTGGQVDTPEHRQASRAAAVQSIVLLKNAGSALPIDTGAIHSVAAIGPNAAVNRSGGGGSSEVAPGYSVSPLEAIRARAGSQLQIGYDKGESVSSAVALARSADVAIVFAGNSAETEAEMFDRKSLDLPPGQDNLIQAVAKANRRTIVVLNAGAPVNVSRWIGQVAGLLMAWFPGQEGGNAIADILFGDANPSARLPVTFPRDLKDAAAYGHYPGQNDEVDYAEGLYIGYRHFERNNIEPQFPFGYGLSYTTFVYNDLKVFPATPRYGQQVQVALNVRNTGARAGAEVVQVYVHDVKSSVDRPVKDLKAFTRVELKPGESREVTLSLDRHSMSFWDPGVHDWATEPGVFEVLVGSSSRDIRLKGSFELFQ